MDCSWWVARLSGVLVVAMAANGCYLFHSRGEEGEADGAVRDDASAGSPRDGGSPGDAGARIDASPRCDPFNRNTWIEEHFNAGGDFRRAVPALSGHPWLALSRRAGSLVFVQIEIGDAGLSIVREIEADPGPAHPVAFDTDGHRFVALTTTGHNWNGEVHVVWHDPEAGSMRKEPWAALGPESMWLVGGAVGLTEGGVVVAGRRADLDVAHLEVRSDGGAVLARLERADTWRTVAVRIDDGTLDVYLDQTRFQVTGAAIEMAGNVRVPVLGGLGPFTVTADREFTLHGRDRDWSGPPPHTQYSPPAVVRIHDGEAVFSLQKELSGVLGFPDGDRLGWLHGVPGPGASGLGVALMPVLGEQRMGFVYLGLEIPRPDQPLRYFGLGCSAAP
jgi:hypothetical protein